LNGKLCVLKLLALQDVKTPRVTRQGLNDGMNLDKTNLAILRLLKANSRMSWQQIGKEVT
jgi:hypothetical protein